MLTDSNHAGEKQTGRSRTRFMIYMNMSLNNWFSEKCYTIETSVFGEEFVTMKVGVEMLHAIQYKLRIMGIPLSKASYIYGDNMLVIHNTSNQKKCNAIAYHAIHDSVAMGESSTGHIRSEDNLDDLLTIVVTRQKRKHLVSLVFS